VVPYFYVFGSGVKHGIFGNTNGTRAITHERYMGTITKVTQRACNPKQLGATTSGRNIFGFCGRLSYTRLFARRPSNKRGTQKLTSPQSRLPIDSRVDYQAQEYIKDTWRFAWRPNDVKSSAMPENECTDTQKTGCPASSPSSTRRSRSCSGKKITSEDLDSNRLVD
jgi:hypothetical protein